MAATLVKIDKNGTKYWEDNCCRRCGGKGYLYGYEHVAGGVCFKCGGNGVEKMYSWKVYTPEYAKVLEERRLARERKKAPELNAKFFHRDGMNENGEAWCVLGKTFEIKDQLKAAGAKWNPLHGWHFDHQPEGFITVKISIEQIGWKNVVDQWHYNDDAESTIKALKDAAAPKTESKCVAEVGEVVDTQVTLVGEHSFETNFSFYGETKYIYKFADAQGNTIVWKTGYQDFEVGKSYKIKGKVKELSEYKGDKQTVLTRCKVVAVA